MHHMTDDRSIPAGQSGKAACARPESVEPSTPILDNARQLLNCAVKHVHAAFYGPAHLVKKRRNPAGASMASPELAEALSKGGNSWAAAQWQGRYRHASFLAAGRN
jgi:hypothetical protein